MDDQEDIKKKDRDIAKRTREGIQQAFPKPGVNWGDKLKGFLGIDDYNAETTSALERRAKKSQAYQ